MVNLSAPTSTPVLTIFTPAYNRGDLLVRLFDSIQSQVSAVSLVEWLVIDDGSSDDTPGVLASFERLRPDLVRSFRVENGGKHRAINRAARLARGAWVMIVDSDDFLAEGAVASILGHLDEIDGNRNVGLLRGLKRFPEKESSHRFIQTHEPSTHARWVATQSTFDSTEVIRTEALRLHPFPEFEGERFMAEGWLWHSLDRTHLTKFVNEAWVTCFYQAGGLSASSRKIRAQSPRGAMAVYEAMLSSPLPWALRIRASANWWRYRLHARDRGARAPHVPRALRFAAPMGWWLYRQDRKVLA